MPRIWINDGLTIDATVQPKVTNPLTGNPEADPTQPALAISFRPPLSKDLTLYLEDAPGMSEEKRIDKMHAFLARYLVKWDATDDTDKPIEFTPAGFAHVPNPYLIAVERAIIEGSMKVRKTLGN